MVADKYRELTELADEIARCGRCGFCQEVCPVYAVSADECGVARGRNMHAADLVSGRLGLSRRSSAFFSECLLCRACVDVCFSSVKTDEIVLAGRRCHRRAYGLSPVHKYMFRHLLPDHRNLGRFIRALGSTRRIIHARLGTGLRIFGWLGASLDRAEQLAKMIPHKFLRERLAEKKPLADARARVLYFIGCGANFMFPKTGEAAVQILEELGFGVTVVEHGCCGMPAFTHGDLESTLSVALRNIEAFSHEPDCLVIADCSSCASFLKDYPKLFSKESGSQEALSLKARMFSERVRDMTEILAGDDFARLIREKSRAPQEAGQVVTFHEPCHLGRYQHLGEEARAALRLLPGIDYVELKQAETCCGGAGTFAVEHPNLSTAILERKIRNIESCGADIVATTCPSCLMQLRAGVAESGLSTRVKHITEIVRECLPGN